jgi:outer membrane biosynthesis protein TonB
MKFHILLFLILTVAISASAQDPARKIVSTPGFQAPQEAIESGLGGRVNVQVEVNKSGDVTSIKQVAGPDWVCPNPKRADALAIQETARNLSMQVKFAPEKNDSTEWIGITFPSSKKIDAKADPKDEKPTTKNGVTVQRKRPVPRMINGGVLNGRAKRLAKPPYPPEARAARVSGIASIKVQIDEDGSIFSAEPIAGHQLLLSASRQAACLSEFSPTRLEGQPVKVTGVITYNFVP